MDEAPKKQTRSTAPVGEAPNIACRRHDPHLGPNPITTAQPMSCGAPTRHGFTPSAMAGARGSVPSTMRAMTSSSGTWRRSGIAGPRWSRSAPVRAWPSGAFAKDIARGLTARSDWGPQYIAEAFGNELAWLGITHSTRLSRAAVQRRHRALHPHAEGAVPLVGSLRDAREWHTGPEEAD